MSYLVCETCMTILQVHGDAEEFRQLIIEHPQWKEGRPCTTFGCTGSMNTTDEDIRESIPDIKRMGVLPVIELDVTEAFRALSGGGLPEEVGVSPEFVKLLLESAEMKQVFTQQSPTGRTLVQRIRVGDLMVHLSSSSYGPCVYKITRTTDELERDRADIPPPPGLPTLPLGDEGDDSGASGGQGTLGVGAGEGRGERDLDEEDHREAAPDAAEVSGCGGDDDQAEAEGVPAADGTR